METKKINRVALIMAGGSGTRFWPLSTNEKPKQFLDLVSEKTMIKETVDRILKLIPSENIFISTNINYLEIVKKELSQIPVRNIIFEPMARDTAACIGYASQIIDKIMGNSIMAVLPSDHLIEKEDEFLKSLEFAFEAAKEDRIITLGIRPSYPETGYGYIEYVKKIKVARKKMDFAYTRLRDSGKSQIRNLRKNILSREIFYGIAEYLSGRRSSF